MPAITVAMRTEISNLYVSLFGRAPDGEGLGFWVSSYSNGNTLAKIAQSMYDTAPARAYYPLFATPSEVVTTFYTNVLGRAPDAEGLAFWVKEYNASATQGAFFEKLINNVVNYNGTDAAGVASKSLFANKVAVAQYYGEQNGTVAGATAALNGVTSAAASVDAAKAVILNTAVSGQTFTLTTGVNNFAGGSSNDSFDASLISSAQTWQASDVLSGGTGIDTINATLISSVTPVNMTGIEVVNVTVNTASTLNLVNATNVTNVNSVNGVAAQTTTLSGIATSVAVSVADTTASHTINYSNVTGSADAATIKVTGIATGTNVFTVAGIETLTLNAATSASVIDTLTAANTTSLLASGDQALTITAGVSATVRNVDASAKTAGGLTMTMGAVADATIVGGAGNDVFTIDAVTGTVTANGGAGNDTFTAATNLTITDTINGGDGIDTLSSVFGSVSTAGYTTPTTRTISHIETLLLTDAVTGALTAVGIDTGITTVTMGVGNTNTAAAVTFNAGTSTLNIGTATSTAATITTSVAVAGSTGGTDSITIKNNNVSTVNAFVLAATVAATNTETLTLDTGTYTTAVAQVTGTVSVTGSTGFQTAETLNIRGGNILTMGVVTADIIDASGMTGVVGTTLTTVTGTTAQTVTGSGGNDVLVIDGTSNVSVNGGAGNDTITGSVGNDILLGGAGRDSITSAAGNDSVDGGAGNDTVVMGTTFTVADTLIGGADVDTLSIGQAATATIAARASEFETLLLSAGATQDMALFTNNTGFTRVNANTAAGTFSFTNVGAGVVTLGAETATTAITFALASGSGTSDSLTIAAVDNAAQTAITAADIETLTINNAATAASATAATITTLSAAALKTLNITGLGGTIITNAITNATGLTAVNDTHTGAGVVTLNLSTSTGAVTYTGGLATGATTLVMGNGNNIVTANSATTVGNFSVTGGTGNDSITGGYGNDSLTGSSGADTLIGSEGNDTLDGGSGNDSLSGGGGIDQFSTESGADTMDGGAGTDVLTISAGFTDISTDTISLIETLIMGSVGATMTAAQHTAFTTITTPAAITLSDAGAVTAKTNVTAYNLANGTNTFTASTNAANNSIVGGTGADTFNFGIDSAGTGLLFTVDDTVTGGTGSDTLNLIGNLAQTVTLTNVSGIENIVTANTTTAVALTLADGNVAAAATMTIDGTSLTTAALTVVGGAETNGSLNIIGGNGIDILTGGTLGDTISGGIGADTIANQVTGIATSGADRLTGGAGIDTFILRGDAASAAPATAVALVARVMDFSVTDGDIIALSNTTANYTAGVGTMIGGGAAAAGATGLTSVATATGSAVATVAATDVVILSTGLATGADIQAMFNTAIGANTITGYAAASSIFVTYFDTTTLQMNILVANVAGGASATNLETADVVGLVGVVDMSAATYAALTNANFAIVAA